MSTYQQVLAKAAGVSSWTVNMCDNFVAEMWGASASGYNTALDNWNASPDKHSGDMNAPAGALMYWGGGDGHVALSTGDGNIITTDLGGAGTVTTQPASKVTSVWGKPYLGWASPYFGGQSYGTVGPWTGSSTGATGSPVTSTTPVGLGIGVSAGSISSALESGFMAVLKPFFELLIWGVEAVGGVVLMGAAVFIMAQGNETVQKTEKTLSTAALFAAM